MKFKIQAITHIYLNIIIISLLCLNLSVHTLKVSNNLNSKDPFAFLGIEDIDPKKILNELDNEVSSVSPLTTSIPIPKSSIKTIPKLKTLDEIPKFLKDKSVTESEAMMILSKFFIHDDVTLKRYGVIYDQTGFDGLSSVELISPPGTEERLVQRAKSSANVFFKETLSRASFDAYGAQEEKTENIPGWKIYKVIMLGQSGENTYVKVCLPIDEAVPALCSRSEEECGKRVLYLEKQKIANQQYMEKMSSGFFSHDNKNVANTEIINLSSKGRFLNKVNDEKKVKDNALFSLMQKGIEKKSDFQFKEKEVKAMEQKSGLEKEIEEMKKQINFLMNTVKEKDKTINQQKKEIEEINRVHTSNKVIDSFSQLGIGNNYGAI